MNRHFYISDSLDTLRKVEHELEDNGVTPPQIHVLSEQDEALERYQLHEVGSVLKKNVIQAMEIGAVIGTLVALIILATAYLSGAVAQVGWWPFVFLAAVAFGFATWEGGLFGIQVPHADVQRFQDVLRSGGHIMLVDVQPTQEPLLERVISHYPQMMMAGTGTATPAIIINLRNRFNAFIKSMP